MNKRIFKVDFRIRVSVGGTYKIVPLAMTVLAFTEEEAKRKLMGSFDCKLSYIGEAKEVELS